MIQANNVISGTQRQALNSGGKQTRPVRRIDTSQIVGENSLRWENEIQDESAEEQRMEEYKLNRRKRYLAAKNISYEDWLASEEVEPEEGVGLTNSTLPDVVTSSVSGIDL